MDTKRRFTLRHDAPYDVPEGELVWPEGVPNYEPEANNEEVVDERGENVYCRFISNIRVPKFYAYPAPKENNTGKAIVVCPGGGYVGTSFDLEGCELARFFNSLGISAFVLNYRIPMPDGRLGLLKDGPLSDALRTIRIVRSRATQYGIDPEKVGIMGFSSGGHVAATASTLYDTLQDPNPELNAISARPSFSILIYPVISLYEGYCHQGSRHNLLGPEPSFDLMKKYSPERQVTKDTPPTFLSLTEDDVVNPLNSLNYFRALLENCVPAELHIYSEGGHGYGMRINGMGVDAWPDNLAKWLARGQR